MKVLLTGGSGLLGQELQKYIKCDAPSHRELDITKPIEQIDDYDLIIHAAAYTDVARAEKKGALDCWKVNAMGTVNLLETYSHTPFVYISSEYAKNPINWYSYTKLAGELAVWTLSKRHLIIRTLFKPRPYLYKQAFTDQYTLGDYVDVIAPLIVDDIEKWNKKGKKRIYVGTGRKTIYDLAKRSRPDVKPISVDAIKEVRLPKDYA